MKKGISMCLTKVYVLLQEIKLDFKLTLKNANLIEREYSREITVGGGSVSSLRQLSFLPLKMFFYLQYLCFLPCYSFELTRLLSLHSCLETALRKCVTTIECFYYFMGCLFVGMIHIKPSPPTSDETFATLLQNWLLSFYRDLSL